MWKEKRVFFITPQILQNDLVKFEDLGSKIKCLVFDEAHRARGNHAYCEVIRKLSSSNKYFRVLALSATPGGTINDVLEVVQNLLISHLEFRTEESPDVSPYVFQRNLTTVVVPLGTKLQEVKDSYMKVLEYYTRSLIRYKVIQGNCANLTKGKIFILMKNYQQNARGTSPNYAEIMKSLNICITLYHASELLIRHGLRSFLTFFEEHIDKPLLRNNTDIREIMATIREHMGPLPQIQQLPDGEYQEVPPNIKFGHPKFYKLKEILLEHFSETEDSSRVIVFFEYRESVMEAFVLLIQSKPVLKPRIFIGQANGVSQKTQISVVKAFREGRCNVLLSTSIGEEGLDVGEVDLIVCFDISNKSPIRMVQRMGRTGRKKDGKIVVLVTEGKEQQTLKDCLIHKNNVAFHVLGSKVLAQGLHSECPRLIPEDITPKCEKIFITVEDPGPKKSGNLKDMLKSLSRKSSELSFSPGLEIVEIEEKIPEPELLSVKENPLDGSIVPNIFNKKIEKQRSFQEIHTVEHSSNCGLLVSLLQMAESRRFNIPMSQIATATQKNKNMKQTDIRNMFFKSQTASDFIVPSTQVIAESIQTTNTEDKNFGEPELFRELSDFLSIQQDNSRKCTLCPSQLNCGDNKYKTPSRSAFTWIELDASVFTNITTEDLKAFEKSLHPVADASFQFDESIHFKIPETPVTQTTQKETKVMELEDLIDTSILADFSDTAATTATNTTATFMPPKSLNNLLNKYSTSLIDENLQFPPPTDTQQTEYNNKSTLEVIRTKKSFSEEETKDILDFFKLETLEDVFEPNIPDSQATITYSPDIFDITNTANTNVIIEDDVSEDSNSPIICSYFNKKKNVTIRNSQIEATYSQSLSSTPLTRKTSEKNIDKLSQSSNKLCGNTGDPKKTPSEDLNDFFDFSFFASQSSKKNEAVVKAKEIINLTDSCNTIDFCEDSSNSRKNSESDANNCKLNVNISDLGSFFDEELLMSPTFRQVDHRKVNVKESLEKTKRKIESQVMSRNVASVNEERVLSQKVVQMHRENHNLNTDKSQKVSESEIEQKIDSEIPESMDFLQFMENDDFQLPSITKNKNFDIPDPLSDFKLPGITKIKNLDIADPPSCQFNDKHPKTSVLNTQTDNTVQKSLSTIEKLEPSQASITQLISLVNKPTQTNSLSQKENIDLSDVENDSFIFSFNAKKPKRTKNTSSSSEKSLNSSIKANIKEHSNNSSINTTLGSKSADSSKGILDNSAIVSPKPVALSDRTKKMQSSSNTSLNTSNSDDEFETKPPSSGWIRTRPLVKKRPILNNSDDEFEPIEHSPVFAKPKPVKRIRIEKEEGSRNQARNVTTRVKSRKLVNEFIENEAELSICDETNVSDDEADEFLSQEQYDASFVADETQHVDTQMHAVYLKSVRSPRNIPGRFKIPTRFKNNMNVFSQVDNEEDEVDSDDSFVVMDETIEARQELSQLEILEKQLEMQKRRKKMPHGIKKPTKRRRIIVSSDSE
uniref:Fanconi anemia group M protein-like n=1 Tax=Diabrotica virgifera virgifera TaxID=50390 RepID=A0A6P7HDG0_DIAVI